MWYIVTINSGTEIMLTERVTSEEYEFLMWLRNLRPESQESLYEGVVMDTLAESLVSIADQELHGLFEITPAIGLQDHGLFVGEGYFLSDVIAHSS